MRTRKVENRPYLDQPIKSLPKGVFGDIWCLISDDDNLTLAGEDRFEENELMRLGQLAGGFGTNAEYRDGVLTVNRGRKTRKAVEFYNNVKKSVEEMDKN